MKRKEIKFTERELAVLNSTAGNNAILSDIRILRKLARAGIVELHDDTGDHVRWNGVNVRCWYVYDVVRTNIEGFVFFEVYRSGCFRPYVAISKVGGL